MAGDAMDKTCILVEGVDSPQKKELVEKLSHVLGWEAVSFRFPSTQHYSYFATRYETMTKKIVDQSHVTCGVLSKYWFGRELFLEGEKERLHEWCKNNAFVILVSPENMPDDGHKYSQQEQHEWERLRLLFWMEMRPFQYFVYHGEESEWRTIVRMIREGLAA